MKKPWKPGDPCLKCDKPVWAEADKYKADRNDCMPCGLKQRREQWAASKIAAATAQPCRVCEKPLPGVDRRYGACKACRQQEAEATNAARRCPCGASIANRSKNARFCENCSARGRKKGGRVAQEKRRAVCEATRVPADTPGVYAPPMTRAEALVAERANYDPARAAWIDAVCARRRVGVRG